MKKVTSGIRRDCQAASGGRESLQRLREVADAAVEHEKAKGNWMDTSADAPRETVHKHLMEYEAAKVNLAAAVSRHVEERGK